MDADQFLAWAEGREGKYELLDGRVTAMSGAQRRRRQLHRVACRSARRQAVPAGIERLAVKVSARRVRRPDVLVDCGPTPERALYANNPVFVLEALSPTTRQSDLVRKLNEYQALEAMLYILFLEPAVAEGILYFCEQSGAPWRHVDLGGIDAIAELPAIACRLPLADLYRGLALESA
jgi:Uma2 family endonuclease